MNAKRYLSLGFFIFISFTLSSTAAERPAKEKPSILSSLRALKANGGIAPAKAPPKNRAEIRDTLRSIIIPELKQLEGYTMSEFVDFMGAKILESDPLKLGVPLIINPFLGRKAGDNMTTNALAASGVDPVTGMPANGQGAIDPVTGLPIQDQNIPKGVPMDLTLFSPENVKIVGLRNKAYGLTALQVLDMVTQSFDFPIQYAIMDYGVVFFSSPVDRTRDFTKAFKVSPKTFNQNTEGSSENKRK